MNVMRTAKAPIFDSSGEGAVFGAGLDYRVFERVDAGLRIGAYRIDDLDLVYGSVGLRLRFRRQSPPTFG